MSLPKPRFLSLDIGEKRIGLAVAGLEPRIASPKGILEVDGNEAAKLQELIKNENITDVIVGLPRNQAGDETKQSEYVREFIKKIKLDNVNLHFQDESVTSVIAEERLKQSKKNYQKGDIDAEAAAMILEDYLEENYGY